MMTVAEITQPLDFLLSINSISSPFKGLCGAQPQQSKVIVVLPFLIDITPAVLTRIGIVEFLKN